MQTGLPTRSTLYTAHETCRAFSLTPPPEREGGNEGALLLLPHSCGLQLEALRLNNGKRRCVEGSRVAGSSRAGERGSTRMAGLRHQQEGHRRWGAGRCQGLDSRACPV